MPPLWEILDPPLIPYFLIYKIDINHNVVSSFVNSGTLSDNKNDTNVKKQHPFFVAQF